MLFLAFIAIMLSVIWVARGRQRRAAIRRVVDWVARATRIQLGSYQLQDVVSQMLELALGTAVPSITRTYLPVRFAFGIARQDADRWGALLPVISEELTHLIVDRARALGYTTSERPRVKIAIEPQLAPGHTRLIAARMRTIGTESDPSDTVRVRAVA
jgi:hypothetical protein